MVGAIIPSNDAAMKALKVEARARQWPKIRSFVLLMFMPDFKNGTKREKDDGWHEVDRSLIACKQGMGKSKPIEDWYKSRHHYEGEWLGFAGCK
ncbi:MAG: hypothetical protein WCD76_18785 [Pyrinomonadaceae bacterium]